MSVDKDVDIPLIAKTKSGPDALALAELEEVEKLSSE